MKIRWQDKTVMHNIPGLAILEKADCIIWFSRLVTLPKEQLEHIYKYLDSGKPIIGLRTANHGFIGFDYKVGDKHINFGNDILGGSFRGHHGRWHQDSTRGIIVKENKDHAILKGVSDIWGPSDVYRTYKEGDTLPKGCVPLVMGQPLMSRNHDDPINPKLKALPVAWAKTWTGNNDKTARVFHSTMGSAKDFESTGMRRMTINAAYWCMKMEDQIKADSPIDYVGAFKPLVSGFNYEKLMVKPRPVQYYK